jgi:hypothetical protein
MTTARDLIDSARLRERVLTLPLRGDLIADHELADAELERLSKAPTKNEAAILAATDRVADLERQIVESSAVLRFRALPRGGFQTLLAAHPARADRDENWNWDTFVPALIAASLVEPKMTEAEVVEFLDVIAEGQRDEMFDTAYEVNQAGTRIPFSERASAVIRWREQRSAPPESGESLPPSSGAAS